MKIHAGDRTFELPPFKIGDRVLWTPSLWRGRDRRRTALAGTVVGINLLAHPSKRLRLWLDEDYHGHFGGLVNGFAVGVDEVSPMPVVIQLAARVKAVL